MKISRVRPLEWLAALAGAVIVGGLFLPWAGGSVALDPPGPLDVLVLLTGVGGVLLPLVIASSFRTNVPIVFETTVWTVSLFLIFIFAVKTVIPNDAGWDAGFWVVFAGIFSMGFFLWRSVARRD